MCDTLVMRQGGQTWFAKNSDREPAEPQRLLRIEAVQGDRSAELQATYLRIPQTAERHALILSQPSWLWGGEMGVNQHGVVIGNEAVFTRLTRRHGEALLGMDLLRLGLERGASAREALAVITEHLERYGQGGPAGYRDKSFRYDNSFLLADADEAWVLETAGQLWAAKRVERWAISNALSLGHEFDLSSADLPGQARKLGCWNGRGDFHFARAFDTRLLPWIGGAHRRRALNQDFLAHCPATAGWAELTAALRSHGQRGDDLQQHDNRQVCLHAGAFWRPSQTTASLIARVQPQRIELAATGTSAPCLGLFQPLGFAEGAGAALLSRSQEPVSASLWWQFEAVHRRALVDTGFRQALRTSRDDLEPRLLACLAVGQADWSAAAEQAGAWYRHWRGEAATTSQSLPRWWRQQADLAG
ncbi:MAG TPA: C69 family dipeptidase [Pseudomonas sp.]|nr:C69 family dipeptidase [Pseudomonas sp.]